MTYMYRTKINIEDFVIEKIDSEWTTLGSIRISSTIMKKFWKFLLSATRMYEYDIKWSEKTNGQYERENVSLNLNFGPKDSVTWNSIDPDKLVFTNLSKGTTEVVSLMKMKLAISMVM